MRASALAVAAPVLACLALAAGCIGPSNPYDPDTPEELQARATVKGDVQDELGAVAGARVRLARGDGEPVDDKDTTDDGAFSFSDLAPGAYTLTASSAQHAPAQTAVVVGAGDTADVTLTLVRASAGALTGAVRLGAQLALPADAQDHSGAIVEIEDTALRTVTNKEGRFDLALAPGTYALIITAPGHTQARVDDVEVDADGSALEDPITLDAVPGALAGTVTLEDPEDASDLSGTMVTLLGGGGSTVTDADGAFTLVDVPAGVHTLVLSRARYESVEVAGVVVQAGVTTSVPERQLVRARSRIEGQATLAGASSHADIVVTLVPSSDAKRTDATGAFAFEGVRAGVYTVYADKDGYQRATVDAIEVLGGETLTLPPLVLAPATGDFDINGGAAYTNDPDVTVDLDASDAAFMMISTDPAFADAAAGDTTPRAYADTSAFTLPDHGDGPYDIYVLLEDANGNTTGPLAASITLDTVAPAPPTGGDALLLDDDAKYTNDTGGIVEVSLEVEDATSFVSHMQLSDDGVFDDEPFVPFSTSLVRTLPDDDNDGLKEVFVRFRDAAGNVSAAFSDSITLDRLPPTVDVFEIDGGATWATSSLVTVHVVGSDSLAGVAQMALSTNGAFPVEVPEPYENDRAFLLAPGEGTRFAYVRLIDAAGNRSDVAQAQIEVDSRAPTNASVQIDGGAALSNSRDVVLSLQALGATTMEITLEDGTSVIEPYATSYPLTLPADGTQTVFVVFTDDAGNASPTVSDTIDVDEEAPVLNQVDVNDGAAFTNDPVVTLTVKADGATRMRVLTAEGCATPLAPTQAAFDAVAIEAYTITKTVVLPPNVVATNADAPPADRCKYVAVQVLDDAGNMSAAVDAEVQTLTLDAVIPDAPQIATLSQTVDAGATFTVALAVDARDHALASYQVATTGNFVDLAPVDASCLTQAALCTFSVPLTANSENIIRLRARDAAGNFSDEDLITIVEDSLAPAAPGGLTLRARDEAIRATWTASTSTDTDGYELLYTLKTAANCPTAAASYTGTFADQGASPIDVGNNLSASLTGMPNGIAVCVAVRAYDRTAPPLRSTLATAFITPFEVTPTLIAQTTSATLGFAANAQIRGLSLRRGVLYVAATNSPLIELDASNDACFSLTDPVAFASCTQRRASADTLVDPVEIVQDGAFVFVADAGAGTKIYRADGESAPLLLFTVGASAPSGIAVARGRLAIASNSGIDVYNLDPLFGGVPAAPVLLSQPTSQAALDVDIQGTVLVGGMVNASNSVVRYNISADTPAVLGSAISIGGPAFSVRMSGDRVYALGQGRLGVLGGTPFDLLGIVNVAAGGDVAAEGPVIAVAGNSGFDYVSPDERRVIGRANAANATNFGTEASVVTDGFRAFHASGRSDIGGHILSLYHATEASAVELLGSTPEVDTNSAQWAGNLMLFSSSFASIASVTLTDAFLDDEGPLNGTGQELAYDNGVILVARSNALDESRVTTDGQFETVETTAIAGATCREVELFYPWAMLGCRTGAALVLMRVDLRTETLAATTTISNNITGGAATDGLESYGAFLYMSAGDGLYRVKINPHTGAVDTSALVQGGSNPNVHRYGRHLWFWTGGTMQAQDLGVPGTWNAGGVTTLSGSGSPSYGNVTEVGGLFFVPTAFSGVNLFSLTKGATGQPTGGALRAIVNAGHARSALVSADRLFVGNVGAMDIHRLR